jgi:hypothetical protein
MSGRGTKKQLLSTGLPQTYQQTYPQDETRAAANLISIGGRERYEQAAFLASQEALTTDDPDRARTMRQMATQLRSLAGLPLGPDFLISESGHQYLNAVRERLLATNATGAQRSEARSALLEIINWLDWSTLECRQGAADLARLFGMSHGQVARAVRLLEAVGAIAWTPEGRGKVIRLTPETVCPPGGDPCPL